MVERLLNQVSLFDVMNEQEKLLLSQQLTVVNFEMGQTIVHIGEQMNAFYIIVSGQARRIKELPDGNEMNLSLLQKGEHFGESALLNNETTDITIRASTELQVLKLSKEGFILMLETRPDLSIYMNQYMASDAMRIFLKGSTIFSNIEYQVLRSLLDKITVCEYTAGASVVTEGEPGDAFYILRSGQAEVVKECQGVVLNKLQAGDFFGELALLKGEPRKATVRTTEKSTLFRLSKEDFDHLISEYPKIKEAILRIASNYSARNPLDQKVEDFTEPAPEPSVSIPIEKSAFVRRIKSKPAKPWRRFPFILQQSEMDCGPTCLSMVCKYYSVSVPINYIKSNMQLSRSGTSLQEMMDSAQSLGFEAEGIRVHLANLSDIQLPAIAHWKGNHYIVVYQVTKEHIYVADPAIGVEKLTHEQFAQHWKGMLLTLAPTMALKESVPRGSTLQRYAAYLKPHKHVLANILLLSVVIQLISLSLPIITQSVIDNVLVHRNEQLLILLMSTMLAISLVNGLFMFVRQWISSKTALKIDTNMVEAFYKHLLGLPLSFFNERTVGDILTRVNENEKIRQILTSGATNLILDLVTIGVYSSLMLYYNPKLFFMAAVIIPLYIGLIYFVSPRMRKNSRKQFQAEAESESTMVEAVNLIASIKTLTAERAVFNQLKVKFNNATKLRLKGTLLWVTAETGGEWIRTLGTITVLYFGSHYVLQGDMSAGELVAFTVLLSTVTQSISFIIHMLDDLMEARISMERLDDVFQSRLEQSEQTQLRTLVNVKGHISFENVTFRYEVDGKNILQNINLEMMAGQTIAIVGRSGSGKSTIANLLMNLYSPSSGMIRVDGHDLRTIDALSLRQKIGVVQQGTAIFRGTILENIAFGQQDVAFGEVEASAMLAGAHDFINELPLRYDTMIGEGGIRLSGGQAQRIAIARALLGNPPILVFDEATSALDTESERKIQNNMELIIKNRTTLIIAHRLSTVKHADRIIVLDQGVVVENGTHEELLQTQGLYYYLVSQQL